MARDRLTALQVKRAHEKGEPVLLPDGAGLYLRKQSASCTAWTLRYRFGGRDRWMALGSYPDMELAEARKAARSKRTLVDAGRDPLRRSRARSTHSSKRSPQKRRAASSRSWPRTGWKPKSKAAASSTRPCRAAISTNTCFPSSVIPSRRHHAGHGGAFARPRGKKSADGSE